MKWIVLAVSVLFSIPSWASIYLVAPRTVVVQNQAGVSCFAEKNAAAADLAAPHFRIPVTLANPQRASFTPTSFRIFVFNKGQIHTCEFSGEVMHASGMGLPIPYGYQMTSSCDLGCGGIDVPAGKKLTATLEVIGEWVFADGTKKAGFQETSFEVTN
ncbi:hypothetical protein AZI86_17700 [Bdellovibrio bacteriovorus]|uniref:Lipoprotein n=1 Tax=Bdellovibrio bacteriovorus TaxID=959 RepID=A0A150WEY7_BDEBC|nr:hypothetical protein [Bdellovibrio bacteriovorus]KYG61542.1 hypothetical protein AZI86_17700 [Bdellovibrio bacteriovorus]